MCRDLLEVWLEGKLEADRLAAFEEHLARCGRCRREAQARADLVQAVAALPEGIAPRRDLWPQIAARMEQTAETETHQRRFRGWSQVLLAHPLAAAAALLVIMLGTLTLLSGPGGRRAEPGQYGGEQTIGMITTAAMEQQYIGATEDLLYSTAEVRLSLPESTLIVLEDHLTLVDQAITESRTVLQKYPSDVELQSMLAAAWKQKLALLGQTARLTGLY